MTKYTVTTNALKERPLLTNLQALRPRPCVGIVFAFGNDEFSGNLDGYWIVAQSNPYTTRYTHTTRIIDKMVRRHF